MVRRQYGYCFCIVTLILIPFFFFGDWLLSVPCFFILRIRVCVNLSKFTGEHLLDIIWYHVALCSSTHGTLNPLRGNWSRTQSEQKVTELENDNDNSAARQAHLGATETSTMISPLQRPQHEIWRNVSALNQWHTNWTSRVLFNAAWAHTHLRNVSF